MAESFVGQGENPFSDTLKSKNDKRRSTLILVDHQAVITQPGKHLIQGPLLISRIVGHHYHVI